MKKAVHGFLSNGVRIGQGKDNARKYIEENPECMEKIERRIRQLSDKIDLDMTNNDLDGISGDDADDYDIDIPLASEEE